MLYLALPKPVARMPYCMGAIYALIFCILACIPFCVMPNEAVVAPYIPPRPIMPIPPPDPMFIVENIFFSFSPITHYFFLLGRAREIE